MNSTYVIVPTMVESQMSNEINIGCFKNIYMSQLANYVVIYICTHIQRLIRVHYQYFCALLIACIRPATRQAYFIKAASKSRQIRNWRYRPSIYLAMQSPQVGSGTRWLISSDILYVPQDACSLFEHVQPTSISTCSTNFQFAAFAEAYTELYIIEETGILSELQTCSSAILAAERGYCKSYVQTAKTFMFLVS